MGEKQDILVDLYTYYTFQPTILLFSASLFFIFLYQTSVREGAP